MRDELLNRTHVEFSHPESTMTTGRSFTNLPIDVLDGILSHALRVSDTDFSIDTYQSPFGRRPASAINILRVCRNWYNTGHPYLYECLIVRNNFQLQSFYNMLIWYKRGKSDNQKAKMERLRVGVRRLRLEYTFGSLLSKILRLLDVTKIESLFIDVRRCNDDRTCSGTVSAIESINPEHVVIAWNIFDVIIEPPKIIESLLARIPCWSRLTTFEIYTPLIRMSRMSILIDVLSCLKRESPLQLIFRLRSSCSFKDVIPILWKCDDFMGKFSTSLLIDVPLSQAVGFEEEAKECISKLPATVKIFTPSRTSCAFLPFDPTLDSKREEKQAQERRIPVSIILRIISFALGDPGRITYRSQYTSYLDIRDRLKALNSSEAYQNYCTNKCIGTTYISSIEELELLLEENPLSVEFDDSGSHMRRRLDQLVLDYDLHISWRSQLPVKLDLLFEAMLRQVHTLSIPLRKSMLPKEPNEQLHTLSLHNHDTEPSVNGVSLSAAEFDTASDVFTSFPNVRHLFLTGYSTNGHLPESSLSYFSQSTVQDVYCDGTDQSLQFVMKYMFTSAEELHFGSTHDLNDCITRPFRLTTVLDHFPSLRVLHLSSHYSRNYRVEVLEPNHTIQKIIFHGPQYHGLLSMLRNVLQGIDMSQFQALEEVQFDFYNAQWERTSPNTTGKLAVMLDEATKRYEVKFTNKSGERWELRLRDRPRPLLQPQSGPVAKACNH